MKKKAREIFEIAITIFYFIETQVCLPSNQKRNHCERFLSPQKDSIVVDVYCVVRFYENYFFYFIYFPENFGNPLLCVVVCYGLSCDVIKALCFYEYEILFMRNFK